jgi:hypothetical protein
MSEEKVEQFSAILKEVQLRIDAIRDRPEWLRAKIQNEFKSEESDITPLVRELIECHETLELLRSLEELARESYDANRQCSWKIKTDLKNMGVENNVADVVVISEVIDVDAGGRSDAFSELESGLLRIVEAEDKKRKTVLEATKFVNDMIEKHVHVFDEEVSRILFQAKQDLRLKKSRRAS